jgi:hypothetical protein
VVPDKAFLQVIDVRPAVVMLQGGLGVLKALKKKKRRNSTPSSPSFSMSPSPSPLAKASFGTARKQQQQLQHLASAGTQAAAAALEVCCESGISSETVPALSNRAAAGLNFSKHQQQHQHHMQPVLGVGTATAAIAGSSCYSPCSQTAGAVSPGPHGAHCLLGPDGVCHCPASSWNGQTPPLTSSMGNSSYYSSCQEQSATGTVWHQQKHMYSAEACTYQDAYGGYSFNSYPDAAHTILQQQPQQRQFGGRSDQQQSQSLPQAQLHQQQHQQMLGMPEQTSSPFQAGSSSSPSAVRAGARRLGAAEQQQHSSSSMSSGSPVGVAMGTATGPCQKSTVTPNLKSLNIPGKCQSVSDVPAVSSRTAATVGGSASAAAPGVDISIPAGFSRTWGGLPVMPSNDCLGALGVRPTDQGKLMSPAAYEMMLAGMANGRFTAEVPLDLPTSRVPDDFAEGPLAPSDLSGSAAAALQPIGNFPRQQQRSHSFSLGGLPGAEQQFPGAAVAMGSAILPRHWAGSFSSNYYETAGLPQPTSVPRGPSHSQEPFCTPGSVTQQPLHVDLPQYFPPGGGQQCGNSSNHNQEIGSTTNSFDAAPVSRSHSTPARIMWQQQQQHHHHHHTTGGGTLSATPATYAGPVHRSFTFGGYPVPHLMPMPAASNHIHACGSVSVGGSLSHQQTDTAFNPRLLHSSTSLPDSAAAAAPVALKHSPTCAGGIDSSQLLPGYPEFSVPSDFPHELDRPKPGLSNMNSTLSTNPTGMMAGVSMSLLAEAPTTVLLQQAAAAAVTAAAAASATLTSGQGPLSGSDISIQAAAGILPTPASCGSLDRAAAAVTGSPLTWDCVGEALHSGFPDASDSWAGLQLADLNEEEVDELLRL